MALTLTQVNDAVNAATINQVINVLQQPSGGVETSHYGIQDSCYVSGGLLSNWILSLSRTAVPISLSIDTSDQTPVNCNNPSTGHLTAYGAQVYSTSTGVTTSAFTGGVYTIQY